MMIVNDFISFLLFYIKITYRKCLWCVFVHICLECKFIVLSRILKSLFFNKKTFKSTQPSRISRWWFRLSQNFQNLGYTTPLRCRAETACVAIVAVPPLHLRRKSKGRPPKTPPFAHKTYENSVNRWCVKIVFSNRDYILILCNCKFVYVSIQIYI